MSQKSVKVQSVDYFMTCFSSSNITRKQGNIDATGVLCLHHIVAVTGGTLSIDNGVPHSGMLLYLHHSVAFLNDTA